MSGPPGVLLRSHCDVLQDGGIRVIMGRLNKGITTTEANCTSRLGNADLSDSQMSCGNTRNMLSKTADQSINID